MQLPVHLHHPHHHLYCNEQRQKQQQHEKEQKKYKESYISTLKCHLTKNSSSSSSSSSSFSSSTISICISTSSYLTIVILSSILLLLSLITCTSSQHLFHPDKIAKSCPHPAVPLYAQVTLSPVDTSGLLKFASTATYQCDDGYELFGSSLRTCQSNGKWTGDLPYCAVNVAYGKPTNQSSTIRGGDSRNANDGDTTILHENKYCTETKNEPSPWWMVDLLQPYEVKVVRILTRGCCGHQALHDIEIRVGNSSSVSGNKLCAWFPGTLDDGTSKDLACAHAIKGRYVFIQMVGVEASLSLCEVFVFTTKEFSSDRCGSRMEHQQLIAFNQTCYEFQTATGGSYTDALDYCKARGGLVVNSVGNVTQNFLYYELERLKGRLKSKLVWLGARRDLTTNTHHPSFHRSRSATWRWVNNDAVTTFLWAEDQPNNYNGQQNCIVLDGGRRWLWNDVTCDLDYLPWICQYTPSNCGSPDKNENSTFVSIRDYRVGKEIQYSCPLGYAVEGDEYRTCQSDGFWSGSPPNCRYVSCGQLNDIPRGRVVLMNESRTDFNATARYICDKDYTLVGNETRICLANSSWSGVAPKCMYSWCPELNLIPNGLLNVTNRTVDGLVTYSCSRGHKLDGNSNRTCQLGGKWTGEEPTCRFIDCGIPLDIRNGRYQLLNSSTTYQSLVKYNCNEDYTLVGNAIRNCTEFANWSGLEPSCKLIDCGKPEIPNGVEIISGDKYTVGSEIKYKCKSGYKLMGGKDKHKCNHDSKWDGDPLECKFIDCGRVPVILKGEVKYINSTTFLDSQVNYSCSYGFKVSGVKIRTCKDDAKWSDSSPKCEEIRCVPPEIPKNSSVVYSGNDRPSSDSFKVGSTVQYRCAIGHIVKGESLRSCESDGSWSGSPPECVYVDCGWPYVIPNGRWLLTTNSTHYGSSVEYECSSNFRINGPARRLCLENATWSSNAPMCELIKCSTPPVKDDKTQVEGSTYSVGEKVSYSCSYGYELVGEEVRTCQSDGTWSNDIPYCRIVDCGRPQVLPNGRGYLLNSSTTFESMIEYHCMNEFKLIGDPMRKCLATGFWSGSLPRCLEIALINEMAENDIDSRADRSAGSGAIHQMESSKAIGIGIAIGIGALLVLVMTIAVVCLKTKKPQPVKNTENIEVNSSRIQDKDSAATVMSYSRLSLESEAVVATVNGPIVSGGSIRHHPNGLVTFAAAHNNGHHKNGGGGNTNVTSGSNSNSNGHHNSNGISTSSSHQLNNIHHQHHSSHQHQHQHQAPSHHQQQQQHQQHNSSTSNHHGHPNHPPPLPPGQPVYAASNLINNNHHHHQQQQQQRNSNTAGHHNHQPSVTTGVTGSTISVAIRSNGSNNNANNNTNGGNNLNNAISNGGQATSRNGYSIPGQQHPQPNGRSILTTTTTLEV